MACADGQLKIAYSLISGGRFVTRIFFALFLFALQPAIATAASIEGRVVSLDSTNRQLTLDTGEMLDLLETVEISELESGQIVRATCEDGTVKAVSVQILEPAPAPILDEPILEE